MFYISGLVRIWATHCGDAVSGLNVCLAFQNTVVEVAEAVAAELPAGGEEVTFAVEINFPVDLVRGLVRGHFPQAMVDPGNGQNRNVRSFVGHVRGPKVVSAEVSVGSVTIAGPWAVWYDAATGQRLSGI